MESLERYAGSRNPDAAVTANGHNVQLSDAESGVSIISPENAPGTHPNGPLPTENQSRCLSAEDDPSVGDTMGAIGQLTNRAMAESRSEPNQPINKLTLWHMVQAALAIDGHDPTASTARKLGYGDPKKQALCSLPPRQDAVEYIRSYLSSMYHIPSLVRSDETTLISHLDHVLSLTPEQRSSQSYVDDDTSTNASCEIYIQVAIGIMVSEDAVRLSSYSHALYSAATTWLPGVLKSRNHVDSLRTLLLLIAFSLLHPGGGSAWHLMGLAIRLCITAGFHKEPTNQAGRPFEDIEEARWLFWSVYVLDRCVISSVWNMLLKLVPLCSIDMLTSHRSCVSVAMDRPFGIQDSDISIKVLTPFAVVISLYYGIRVAVTLTDEDYLSSPVTGRRTRRQAHLCKEPQKQESR